MTGRPLRYVTVAVVAVLILLLLVPLLLMFARYWTYWSYRTQAESYISDIEKFKLEHGFYPDPRTQTIVPEGPHSYGSDGQRYCVGFMIDFDDDYSFCSHARRWAFGLGTIFDWPTGPWPPAAAPNDDTRY